MTENINVAISDEIVMNKIYAIRNLKVMIDWDLAELYGVETKQLKRAVRRNINRFPDDFMFELTDNEFSNLRSQIGTSNWGGTRYLPSAFTEQGVAMLSSVLTTIFSLYAILIFPSLTCFRNSFCSSKVIFAILSANFSLIERKILTLSNFFSVIVFIYYKFFR
jgi:hypothetical protein